MVETDISFLEERAQQGAKKTEGLNAARAVDLHRATQSSIARSVIYLYIGLVMLVSLVYIFGAIWTGPANAPVDYVSALTKAADNIREFANTLLLPIVTLVLGYYFGRRAE